MGLTGRSLIITVLKCLVNQSAQLFLLRPSLWTDLLANTSVLEIPGTRHLLPTHFQNGLWGPTAHL